MTEQNRGRIIIVSGPSGVGKGTILRRLFDSGDFPLVLSVSATTRSPRPGEQDGVHYQFLSDEEFQRCRANGDFVECFQVFGGAWYGTLRETVEKALASGQWLVLEIDLKGAQKVLELWPEAISIFILPPSDEELFRRLAGRGTEDEVAVKKRLVRAREELKESTFYKYKIVNDSLDRAVEEFRTILNDQR